ncbi:hypothetical protein TNCV_2889211 [Trichonephila clavipes]|nr:hypothetical protein TNCV_2889211 [Trichonephila clavipes]
MPPNTLRVHTEYLLVKSVGPKVLWVEAAEGGDISLPSSPTSKLWRLLVSPSIIKKSNLSQAVATFIPSLREVHDNNNHSQLRVRR